jgi:hypothetical protein
LLLVMRDQRKALMALDAAEGATAEVAIVASKGEAAAGATPADAAGPASAQPAATVGRDLRVAAVERGRIASIGGVTALIWLVILVLMVWH